MSYSINAPKSTIFCNRDFFAGLPKLEQGLMLQLNDLLTKKQADSRVDLDFSDLEITVIYNLLNWEIMEHGEETRVRDSSYVWHLEIKWHDNEEDILFMSLQNKFGQDILFHNTAFQTYEA